MEIKIKIDDIDYASVLNVLMPLLAGSGTEIQDKSVQTVISLLGKSNDLSSKLFSVISQETKDNMCIQLMNSKKDFIIDTFSKLLSKNNISAKIKDIEFKND